jgi:hypothetical protein
LNGVFVRANAECVWGALVEEGELHELPEQSYQGIVWAGHVESL